MSRARRVDANQAEIVKFIRYMGGSWQHTHTIPGALDGVLGYRGVDVRIEIKDGTQPPSRRTLTPDEIKTIDEWKGRKPEIIESEEDIKALLNRIALNLNSK